MTKQNQDLIDNPDAQLEQNGAQQPAPTQQAEGRESVELDEPIQRGKTVITELQIRKPVAGELRGVSLIDLAQLDVLALRKVLPRITSPNLTDQEIGSMSPADILQCGVKVAGFLLTKQQKARADSHDA